MRIKPQLQSRVDSWLFVSLCIFIFFIAIIIKNVSKTEDFQPLTISQSLKGSHTQVLLKTKPYKTNFKASNDNLGTVSLHFDTTRQVKSGLVLFQLKELSSKNWYYSNTYRTDQFMNNGLFPFGFPPILNSKNKIYEINLTFLQGTPQNYLKISNPSFVAKYSYTRGSLHSLKDIFSIIRIKVMSILGNMNVFDVVFICSPLVLYSLLLKYQPAYTVWFVQQWSTFLSDIILSISLVKLFKWKRVYEIATILLCVCIFIASLFFIKNRGPIYMVSIVISIALLLLFLSKKLIFYARNFFSQIGLIFVLTVHTAIKATLITTNPNWDGSLYFYWINDQITAFNIDFSNFGEKYSLFGHPAQGYMSYLTIGRALFGTSYLSIHILNTLLGLAVITAFYAIGKRIYKSSPLSLTLFTLIFALNPLFIANSLTPNLDYPTVCFFAIALSLLLYDKLILSTFFWILLAFSKETGLLLYGFFIFFELITSFFRKSLVAQVYFDRLKMRSKHVFHLLFGYVLYIVLPFLLFTLNYFMRSKRVWQPNYYVFPHNPIVFNFEIIFTRFVESFILNFQWVILLLFVISLIKLRKIFAPPSLILTTFAFYSAMAIYNTFLHPRYIVPIHFLFILIAAPNINLLLKRKLVTYGLLIFLSLLLLIQNYITIDLLTMKLMGTFRWGKYSLIKFGDSAQSRCDGFAYNTQHTYIKSLYKELHQELGNEPYSIVVNDLENNLQSNRWVQQYGFAPLILVDEVIKSPPQGNVYYVFLPWLTNNQDLSMKTVKKYYTVGEGRIVDQNGYWLRYYKLTKLP